MTEAPRESLLTILFGQQETARRAAESLSSTEHWSSLFQTAETWSVVPQLAGRIEELCLQPPVDPWRKFQRLRISTYARSASRAARGAAALRRLEAAGIPALAFKGLASMATLYSTPSDRTIKDADLLVERTQLGAALASLAGLGFESVEGYDLTSWERFVANSPGFSGNRAIVLSDRQSFEIDLHWSVGTEDFEPAVLLQRRQSATLFAKTISVVSVADGMALTARHAIRENLSVDAMSRDLLDIRQACSLLGSQALLEPVLGSLAQSRSKLPVLALTRVLRVLADEDANVSAAEGILSKLATPRDRESADQLQALFFHQVRNGPIGKDLFYLAHSRPLRQILAGAVTNWREYRDYMRSMEEKLDGGEVPLGRRLSLFTKALKDVGPSRWHGIRTLARLKYGG